MARNRRSGRAAALNRFLPAGYGLVALLVVAFLLPSALRPPPDTTQSGSEYSPDAPPNAKAQSLIKTQFQPGSNTAGQEGGGNPKPTPSVLTVSPPPKEKTGASSNCSGDSWTPKRQWDSVYAPLCMADFIGNNGGALEPGITSTQWNMIVSFYGQQQTDGWINDASAKGSDQLRTLNDIQKYFNKHAMMYGRKLALAYATEGSATADESTQRSDVTDAIGKYHPIAAQVEGSQAEINEWAKNHVVNDSWLSPIEKVYQQNKPWSWSQLSPDLAANLTAEWACKQLKDGTPIAGVTSGQATFDPKKKRTWGSLEIALPWGNSGPTLIKGLKTCGINSLDQAPGVDMANEIQQALLKLQSENVSTVIMNTDIVDAMAIEIQAEGIGYYPEWITTGWGGLDQDAYLTRDVPVEELGHTFGLTIAEVNLAPNQMECYKAVAEVDPGFVAHPLYCHIYWEMISHAVAAVQLNGAHLTRANLAKSYLDLAPVGTTKRENWALVGDYNDPLRRSWPKAATVYWWDPNDVDADGSVGTYAYADCGQRYTQGNFPSGPAHIFTKAGFVTGPTYYSKPCKKPSWSQRSAVQAPLTSLPAYDGAFGPLAVLPRRWTVGHAI